MSFPRINTQGTTTGRISVDKPNLNINFERIEEKVLSQLSKDDLVALFADPECDYHLESAIAMGHITSASYSDCLLRALTYKAERIAMDVHAKQKDRGGKPYFEHPSRLAKQCETYGEKIVAYLHDTIEDTFVTVGYLRAAFFPEDVIDDIQLLTHLKEHSYKEYIERIYQSGSARAKRIKELDLLDNMNITRLKKYSVKDIDRITKYATAYAYLQTGVWLKDIEGL